MYTSPEKSLEASKSRFAGSDNLTYFTVFNYENMSLDCEPDIGTLTGENVKAWMKATEHYIQTQSFLEGLIVVFSACQEDCNTGHKFQSSLQMRHETYLDLSNLLNWPNKFLRMINEDFMGFHSFTGKTPDKRSSFLLQSPTLRSPFSIALSYDPKMCLTTTLIHGPSTDAFPYLAEYLIEHRKQISVPLLIGIYYIDKLAYFDADRVVQDRKSQLDIESRTGTRPRYHFESRCCTGRIVNNYDDRAEIVSKTELEFSEFTGKLTALCSALKFHDYILDEFLLVLEKFIICLDELEPSQESAKLRYLQATECIQREYIPYIRTSMKSTQRRCQYMLERCQIQAQTVYNGVLKQISEDTKREGATMKLLVTIATVFLPATFMASFFDMPFFDFQTSRTNPTVSSWIWLYFVVTIVFSLLIWIWIQWGSKKNTTMDVLDSLKLSTVKKGLFEV